MKVEQKRALGIEFALARRTWSPPRCTGTPAGAGGGGGTAAAAAAASQFSRLGSAMASFLQQVLQKCLGQIAKQFLCVAF